jgi:hypothetical protein
MNIDILLAFLMNIKTLAIFVAVLGGFVMFCFLMTCTEEEFKPYLNKIKWRYFPIWVLFVLISLTPSIKEIWEVRIALIKYQLASPENIAKSTEEISRIAKKLECEYLGCKDEESK